ncbi:putative ribonuclease H-like domain-containing protein [Tanacetum coccineum]
MTHPSPKRNMIPKAVLIKSGLVSVNTARQGNPRMDLQDKGVINNGCLRHMTGNVSYLTDYEEIDGGYGCLWEIPQRRENHRTKGRKPTLGFMRPFGCPVTILNTIDHLGKFDGSGPNWLFDIDALTKLMNYKPVVAGNQSNGNACTKACDDAGKARMETVPGKDYILLPLWPADLPFSQNSKSSPDVGFKPSGDNEKKVTEKPGKEGGDPSNKNDGVNSTNNINTASDGNSANNVSSTVNTVGIEVNVVSSNTNIKHPNDLNMPELEDIMYSDDYKNVGVEADINNLNTFMPKNPKRNKKDERGIVIKIKARLVAQGYTQEEGIDYDEVFASVARIESIRLFLAYASFKDFLVYQIDVKSAFLYGKIEEEVYVCQPLGFEDPDFSDRVYKVEKELYRLHQAPRAWYETLSTYLLDNGFQRGKIDKTLFIRRDKGDILLVQVYVDDIIFGSTKKELCNAFEKLMHEKFQMSYMGKLTFFLGLQVKQKNNGIFISQDKYVDEIFKKFGFTEVKTASTPMETQKPLLKDEDGKEVDVHLYRSIIGSLMYLTSSRPDIMFALCTCARYQVNLEVSHLHAVKRIFRLISWQCKKQNMVANSATEAEYVAASSCCGQTDKNVADLLTKAFDVSRFQYLIASIGMLNP